MVTVGVQNGSESPTGPSQVVTKAGYCCDVGGDSDDGSVDEWDPDRSPDNSFDVFPTQSSGVPVSTSRTRNTRTSRMRKTHSMTHANAKRARKTYSMTHARTTRTPNTNTKMNTSMMHARTTCTQPLPYMHAYTQIVGSASTPCCGEAQSEASEHTQSCRGQSRQGSQKGQGQGQELDPLLNLPGGQWLPARSQIYDRARMLNKKTTLNSVKPPSNTDGELLPSERKGLRLLQTIVQYRDANGVTKTGRVKLDTCSNGCYALPGISLPRP